MAESVLEHKMQVKKNVISAEGIWADAIANSFPFRRDNKNDMDVLNSCGH